MMARISASIASRSSSWKVCAVGQLEVVVEAVLDRRTDRELGAREQPRDGLRHHVGGRVPQHMATVLGVLGDDRHRAARWERSGQIGLLPVDRRRHRRLGEPLADRTGQIEGGRAGRQLALGSVGQGDGDVRHDVEKSRSSNRSFPGRFAGRRQATLTSSRSPLGSCSSSTLATFDGGSSSVSACPAYTLR